MAETQYDYIIVGAGSAGCVLADRLSRDGHAKVLVLEAGGSDRRPTIKVPLGYAFTFANPRVNWCYTAEPDPGLNGRASYWPRGRVIGGSSSINAMAYIRGLARDFDDWEAAGANGWGWSTVRDVFAQMERHREVGSDGQIRRRGSGPVRVTDLSAGMHPFSRHFLDAAGDLGWPVVDDINATPEGLGYYRSTVRGGLRFSAADAFLRPALKRSNLHLVTRALVERLQFSGRRATGLSYRRDGRQITASARVEVILSAGAVNTPQLLQLSGLGPAGLLQTHGIEVVHDLAEVGQGLQDHLAITQEFAATGPTLNQRLGSRLGQVRAGLQYLLSRRGPLSVPVNQVGGFARSSADQPAPDVQLYCNPASYSIRPGGLPQIDRTPGFLLSAQPCRPTSRGAVTIASADPHMPPRIRPHSLTTDPDRASAVRASRLLRALAATPTLARVTRTPKAPDISDLDDAGLLEDFRARAGSVFHASSTCRMGRDASESVLDARLRVHGIGGLRVVDTSAFPNITSGNTNAPTMMLAMRAADLILEDARPG